MRINSTDEFLFKATGAKRWLNRPRLPHGNALFPKTYDDKPTPDRAHFIFSDDPATLKMNEYLAETLTKEFPKDTLPSGFAGPSAVPGDFYNLLNVSGHGMDPMPLPLMDNSQFVKALGLRDSIRPEDKPWLQELIKLFFGHAVPSSLYIRKAASTSFPFFTTDNQYKKLATLKALHNPDDFLRAMTTSDAELRRGLEEYHALHVYALHERQSPNTILRSESGVFSSKTRTAPSESQARSGRYGGETPADMSVRDEFGNVIANHFAMRRRGVWGYNGIGNYFMTAIMGCHREVYLNRFSFTYKTRGSEDKEEKISAYEYVVGSDVKAMDTTFPQWFFDFLYSELKHYWAEPLIIMLKRMLEATAVCPPPWLKTPDSYNPVFGPSPLTTGDGLSMGLPSGIFINPDLGKLFMTFVYLIVFRDSGALRTVDEIEPFLQGKNKQHALQDMSDDAAMLTNSAVIAEKLKKATSPYMVLEPEIPVLFLGDVYTEVEGRKRAFPNPITYAVNALVRESSIAQMNPILYAEGVMARQQRYSATPIYRDLSSIIENAFKTYHEVNPFAIARVMSKRQQFGELDALVRENPHYLHYRVDPKDVSPEILDELVSTIPASDFFNKIRHLFKVPTIQLEELM